MHALQGIRVLDLTRLLPGALATMCLADFGADVVKIEQPGTGDSARHLFTAEGENPIFAATNRGKRSIAINLKSGAGMDAAIALADRTDVLVESFRPGVMERLGLGFDRLHRSNGRLIYVALTGYGQSGPMRDAAGHDLNYLAMAGVLDLIGQRGREPVIPGVQIADIAGGAMQVVIGVLLALAARERSGKGQFVDVSMTQGVASLLAVPLAHLHGAGQEPERGQGILSGQYACYSLYECRDRRWIAIGALEAKFWESLCRALGRTDLIPEQFAPEPRQSEIRAELGALFARKPVSEWVRELAPYDCCATPVRTVSEAAGDNSIGADEPWPCLSGTPGRRGAIPPQLGEHTREVLLEAGLRESKIEELFKVGSIA